MGRGDIFVGDLCRKPLSEADPQGFGSTKTGSTKADDKEADKVRHRREFHSTIELFAVSLWYAFAAEAAHHPDP
jgi:hypothetical protein